MNSIGRANGGYVKKLVSAVKDIPNSNEDQNSDRAHAGRGNLYII